MIGAAAFWRRARSDVKAEVEDATQAIEDLGLQNLKVEVDNEGIATVSLDRPDTRNALNAATVEERALLFTPLPRTGVEAFNKIE